MKTAVTTTTKSVNMKTFPSIEIRLITEQEFLATARELFSIDHKDYTAGDYFDFFSTYGFPKYDRDHLNKFVSDSGIYFPNLVVDIGNREFIWMVSGSSAILIKRPVDISK